MNKEDWKSRLREAVEKSGKSMAEISLSAGCSRGYLSEILSVREPEPTFRHLVAIVDQLPVSLSFIAYGYEMGADEEYLLRMFASLTPGQKDAFLRMAEQLSKRD